MRVIEIQQYGGPEVLQEVDRPTPAVGPGQVLVRVQATTVNPVDLATRQGYTQPMHPEATPPLVLGWDLAGVIEVAGEGFAAGERVAGLVQWFQTHSGTYSELLAVDAAALARIPEGIEVATAAALPLNGLTALQAFERTGASAGQTLLVTGVSGAVGAFAAQLAVQAGAQVLAVGSFDDDSWVTGLGAKEVLPRSSTQDLIAAVRELVPGGVDAVLDAAPAGAELIGAARDGGAHVTVTDQSLPSGERGIAPQKVDVQPSGAQLEGLLQRLADGRLALRVASVQPIAQIAQAHERADQGGLRGKLVLTF